MQCFPEDDHWSVKRSLYVSPHQPDTSQIILFPPMLLIIALPSSCIHSISGSPQCTFYDDPNNFFKGRGNGDLPLSTSPHRIFSSFCVGFGFCHVQQAKKVIEDKAVTGNQG